MKILAVDSSGLTASAAIVTETEVMAEYTVNYKKTHSQTLLPMVETITKMVELNLQDLDAIAAAKGPGSFTGLRIGAALVKGLGLALDKPIAGVPTVDAIAYNLYGTENLICPMMDAKRQEVYTGLYTFLNGRFTVLEEQRAIAVTELADLIGIYGDYKEVIFLGDGAEAYREKLQEIVPMPYSFAPPHLSKQRAAAVGMLALTYLQSSAIESADTFCPVYLRLSQAERERKAKEVLNEV